MAQFMPHLLSESTLRRHEDCAAENAKLADCWKGRQVVILTIDWADGQIYPNYRVMPMIRLNILSPDEKPILDSISSDRHPTRQFCRRSVHMVEQKKKHTRFQPNPYYMKVDEHETFDLHDEDAKKKVHELFDGLAAEYTAICIVSIDVQDSMKALGVFGATLASLPSNIVFVDLVKVLEHQTRDGEIPEELQSYTDQFIAMRNGRYDRCTGPVGRWLGLTHFRLLEVLGPAAESRRQSFKKSEKEDAALKRIAARMRGR
ncbi:uncharacterized protein CTRU02_201382 [Colletotrichum truncatum]|uniref:Uncharacterized protein n=1 Tax=Colletotrichum truncatum TaxID=5467 RepID=A0ACC3ZH72_COLTU|nr:uncharacterized protein CTRU02_08173 [Colletotrichum truncatum]KAF6790653.1 hypothetical protein CTRU02_08173 [Colletotrichum truncatum]